MAEDWDTAELHDQPEEPVELITQYNTGKLTKIIDDYLKANPDTEERKYIGASSIGNPCERKIWYSYQGSERIDTEPTMQRTFNIGHRLEELILDYLEWAGLDLLNTHGGVFSVAELQLSDKELPEFQGHADAIWTKQDGTKVIIEVKTARDSSFRIFQKKGLQAWYPVYYSQVQAYMGMSGINEAYVIAINKDTSELHDEAVGFDEQHYALLKTKARRILEATEPPPKINQNPCYFMCRNCQYRGVCHV